MKDDPWPTEKIIKALAAAYVINGKEFLRQAADRLERAEGWREIESAEAEFEVRCNGEFAAGSWGPRERALSEAIHYAAEYSTEGPVEIFEVFKRPLPSPPVK